MTNAGYIIAAYGITLGALALYALHLWRRLCSVEGQLTALTIDERLLHDRQ